MTFSRKTFFCLTLLILLAVAMARGNAGPARASGTVAPAPAYTQATNAPRSVSLPSDSVTPARYRNWRFPELVADEENRVIESPLVIPAKEMDVEATGRIVEDLAIMARILEKNVLDTYGLRRSMYSDMLILGAPMPPDMGPRMLFPSVGRPKPLYVGGYGAVFFIQVDFPLLPPPQTAKEPPADTQADPVWSQTKRSLLEPRSAGAAPGRDETAPPYNQGKVDSLRRSLIAAMKHAANIRILEPKDSLIIVVQGFGPSTESAGRGPSAGLALPAIGATPVGRSVMTLRATKADVDSYARGQLDPTQFEGRVQVVTY